MKPQKHNTRKYKNTSYAAIGENGIPILHSIVQENDVVIGKCVNLRNDQGGYAYRDASTTHKNSEPCRIDGVWTDKNSDGYPFIKVRTVSERIPQRFGLDPVRDVQVLCPMNRGGLGAQALNQDLQRLLNPHGAPVIERYGQRFAVGDKVMQIENDYDKEVYNGDLGVVRAIAVDDETMTVEFDGRAVTFDFGDLDRLVLAYATTVHKSQGSEYPAVVIPVTTQHYPMLQRHLLYTGVTRGKRLVVLVGQPRALGIAVRGAQARRRWSQLRALLQR